jgi:hypothetical protein
MPPNIHQGDIRVHPRIRSTEDKVELSPRELLALIISPLEAADERLIVYAKSSRGDNSTLSSVLRIRGIFTKETSGYILGSEAQKIRLNYLHVNF